MALNFHHQKVDIIKCLSAWQELHKNVDPLRMLRFVRFFYTILYTRTGGEGSYRGDVGVSLLIVFKRYGFER